MLTNAIILILREVLESTLLITLLLALSSSRHQSVRWLFIALPIGAIGALCYGHYLTPISIMLDYTGQEWFGIGLHLLIFIAIAILLYRPQLKGVTQLWLVLPCALSLIREGAEVLLYLSAGANVSSLLGALLGMGIGISIAILLYYGIVNCLVWLQQRLSVALLAIVGASQLSQIAPLLIQIDLLGQAAPLWDSSFLIDESSLIGELLFALAGYEATPSLWQVAFYLFGLITLLPMILMRTDSPDSTKQ